VYGTRGTNFLLTILRLARSKPELRVVNDQTGSPTWSRSIAQATAKIVEQVIQDDQRDLLRSRAEHILHLTAGGSTTWFEFAKRIVELADVKPCPELQAISTEEFNAAAPRPAYSVLDCSSTAAVFGVRLGDWRTTLGEVMADVAPAAR
jgi:dTDP-4-dehydrorhamnose reductase